MASSTDPLATNTGEPSAQSGPPKASWLVYPSLLLPHLLLLFALGVALAFFSWGLGLPGERLESTVVTNSAPIFGSSFVVLLGLSVGLSRRTGTPLPWVQRALPEVALGAGLGLPLLGLHHLLLFDWLHTLDVSFDPRSAWMGWPSALFMFGTAVLAEEAFFRGWALDRLRTRHGTGIAVLLSSAAYGMLAPGPNLVIKLWAITLGMLYCGLRLRTGSLLPGVLVHLCLTLGPRLLPT
jgi:membrane protease YdiL (CAAX protease family)